MRNVVFFALTALVVVCAGLAQTRNTEPTRGLPLAGIAAVGKPDGYAFMGAGAGPATGQPPGNAKWAGDGTGGRAAATPANRSRAKWHPVAGERGSATGFELPGVMRNGSEVQNVARNDAVPLAKPAQSGPAAFVSIDSLLLYFPDAVSIEIRISDDANYNAAVDYYKKAFGTGNPSIPNAYSHSWAKPFPVVPASVEFLVINTSKTPGSTPPAKPKDGIVGYVEWPGITTSTRMASAYDCAIETGAFTEEERPGKGPRGPLDIVVGNQKTVRAILKKKEKPKRLPGKLLKYNTYYGVIINPPVP